MSVCSLASNQSIASLPSYSRMYAETNNSPDYGCEILALRWEDINFDGGKRIVPEDWIDE